MLWAVTRAVGWVVRAVVAMGTVDVVARAARAAAARVAETAVADTRNSICCIPLSAR